MKDTNFFNPSDEVVKRNEDEQPQLNRAELLSAAAEGGGVEPHSIHLHFIFNAALLRSLSSKWRCEEG